MRLVDLAVIKSFLSERLSTRRSVEEAAAAIGVSAATMYRYKSNPEALGLGQLIRLSDYLGLPLTSSAAWSRTSVVESERRRLELERAIALETQGDQGDQKPRGRRFQIVPAYTVNSEIPEITRIVLGFDYGTRTSSIEDEIMKIREERARLYEGGYESWEIWNGFGYRDFYEGRNRYKAIPPSLREEQVARLVETSKHPDRHRFIYCQHSPDLPMFGCFSPIGVALVRVDDIHLEFQDPHLVDAFEDTFNEYRRLCLTSTPEEFVAFLENPSIPSD